MLLSDTQASPEEFASSAVAQCTSAEVACYRIARGQAGFSDGIEYGAHLLLAEAFDVYTNVAN
jgi:hypothetical protein